MAKQVSKSKLDKIVKTYVGDVRTVRLPLEDEMVEIEVKQSLSYSAYTEAIGDMINLAFVEDEHGKFVYVPEQEEFARRYVFLKYFTNIDAAPIKKDGSRDPDFVARIWGIYDAIDHQIKDSAAEPRLMGEVETAARAAIADRRKELDVDAVRFWKTLNDFVETMQNQFGEMSEEDRRNVSGAMQKLANISESDIIKALRE